MTRYRAARTREHHGVAAGDRRLTMIGRSDHGAPTEVVDVAYRFEELTAKMTDKR